MACPFCATGQGGLERNLSTAEIVDQVRQAAAAARDGALGDRPGCPTSCSWAWASPWPTTSAWSRRCGGSPTPRPTGSGSPRAASRSRPSGSSRPSTSWPPRDSRHPRRLPARAGRRAARHAGPRQQPLEGRRGPRRRPPLRDHDGPPRLDRVRADPRRQRPAVACGPARHAPAPADRDEAGARQPHPAQPHPGEPLGRLTARGAGRVRPPRAGRRESRAPSATPVGGRSPPPVASSPLTRAARHRDTAVSAPDRAVWLRTARGGADCAACSSP